MDTTTNTETGSFVEYDESYADSGELEQTQSASITGLSSFLALALYLDIPILSSVVSSERWQRSALGTGASFRVDRSYIFRKYRQMEYLGPSATIDGNATGLGDRLKNCKSIVSKRIKTVNQSDDGKCLASMVTEIRILGHSTLREHDNIVRMLCLDWSGDCADITGGRCWPILLLECASYGTLDKFLLTCKRSSWATKWKLFADIADGLQSLHEHSIAHCDLKMDNILVSGGSGCVVAQISDFGFSVIISDYDSETVFRKKAGTHPWNAPELAFGLCTKVRDLGKADIYSMGLVFCAMALEGHAPWGAVSTMEFQKLKEKKDDTLVSECLREARSGALQQQEEEWVQKILDVTVKTNPNHRSSAGDLLMLVASEFLAHINAIAVPDESGKLRLAVGLRRGNNAAATPLPNIFSTSEDLGPDSESFTGVPDVSISIQSADKTEGVDYFLLHQFENPSKFKPWLLYKHALREIREDLEKRAKGRSGDSARVVSEVLYQLSLCYLEGYGVEKDEQRGLEYFREAFQGRSIKARRAARNFYEAFGREFPANMESTEAGDLLCVAKIEVARGDRRNCPYIATEALSLLYHSSYEKWVCSDDFRDWRLQQFAGRAAELDVLRGSDGLSSVTKGLIELAIGLPYLPDFDQQNPVDSTLQVLNNLHRLGPDNLTMLHHAAARGDSRLVGLFLRLGANVNAATPDFGWTPLWMACEGGYFDLAVTLLDHDADIRCRETTSGRTILHLLSRFQKCSEIRYVLQKAIDSGLDVDEVDSRGRTPLFATFIGWDLSRGKAARMLLEEGSNPFKESQGGWYPLMCCVELLDPDLLGEMLSCPARKGIPDETVWDAMVDGLCCLISHPPSTHISRLGKRREGVIKRLLTRLSSDESTQRFLLRTETRGLSPLAAATWLGEESLALWLLELRPQDINLRKEPESDLALHLAIKQNHPRLVEKYLEHDADLLICDNLGQNALHVAAVWMPSMLVSFADIIFRVHCGRDYAAAKRVLDCRNARGFTPFAMTVFEGSKEHIECAEIIRAEYGLDHDLWIDSCGETLLGNIVHVGATIDAVNRSQVEYLLRLTPTPAFVAGRERSTLLQHAVLAWKNVGYSDGALGYLVLSSLLEMFPTLDHIQAQDDLGCTVLMTAASCANHVAVGKIKDHAAAKGLAIDVNATERRGFTALDLLGGGAFAQALSGSFGDLSPKDSIEHLITQRPDELDPMTLGLLSRNIKLTKELLLEMGAVRSVYLSFIRVWTLIAPYKSIRNERLVQFLSAMKQEHDGLNFEPPEGMIDPVAVAVFLNTLIQSQLSSISRLENTTTQLPGSHISLECEWRIATFTLSIKIFDTVEQAQQSAIEQGQTARRLLESWSTNVSTEPWSATKYERGPPDDRISWDRRGRIWSVGEIDNLRQQVGRAWQEITGCERLMEY